MFSTKMLIPSETVVIAIIGVLVAIAIPVFSAATRRAEEADRGLPEK